MAEGSVIKDKAVEEMRGHEKKSKGWKGRQRNGGAGPTLHIAIDALLAQGARQSLKRYKTGIIAVCLFVTERREKKKQTLCVRPTGTRDMTS